MGSCSSKIEGLAELIAKVDPNDVVAVKQLLADCWNIYHLIDPASQKKLDALAANVSNLAKSP